MTPSQPTALATEEPHAVAAARPELVSVVVPAFNEEHGISAQIERLRGVMDASGWPYELIVVDDGSTDGTAEAVRRYPVRLVRQPRNRGYGAALKAGIAAARSEWIIIIDADGTYPPETIPAMLEKAGEYDMVVGARIGENVNIPLMRRPAKWLLGQLASFLAEQEIPDLNSGLRVLKKALVDKFEHLLPSGFSFTTTITMALLCNDYSVYYLPIEYHKRTGASKIRARHAYHFLLLILRVAVYFNPLRIFLPVGAVMFSVGLAKFIYDFPHAKISITALMGILGGIIIWSVGLLADQIARIGLYLRSK